VLGFSKYSQDITAENFGKGMIVYGWAAQKKEELAFLAIAAGCTKTAGPSTSLLIPFGDEKLRSG
jgi:hypothetical protein